MLKKLAAKWDQYKYRFVPWLAVNLKNRKLRAVPKGTSDKIITDQVLEQNLLKFLEALHNSTWKHEFCETCLETPKNMKFQEQANFRVSKKKFENSLKGKDRRAHNVDLYERNLKIMKTVLGFSIERSTSHLKGGGHGVHVTAGTVPQGAVVALYPGTVYDPFEPIFFQSLHNQFIFRCIDGVYIDGNDRGISKMIYRSSALRDRLSLDSTYDMTWLSAHPVNPLAVGQYVNNQSKEYPANVAYQEFDITTSFPHALRKFIPNVHFSPQSLTSSQSERNLRVVALISVREIQQGEELFSSYFTVVHS